MCAPLMMHGPRMMAMVAMIRAVVARVVTVMDRSIVDDPMGYDVDRLADRNGIDRPGLVVVGVTAAHVDADSDSAASVA